MVQVFTGEGRGKTSAAIGSVIRALGHGLKVHIIFFMKGNFPFGEQKILSLLDNVSFTSYGSNEFVDPDNIKPPQKEGAQAGLRAAREALHSGKYDLIVLDEINVAVHWKLVDIQDVLGLIKEKPASVELILTGRDADPKLIEQADLVTEMRNQKHPFEKGIDARAGIEY